MMTPMEIKHKCYEEAYRIQTTTMWYLWIDGLEDVAIECGSYIEYGIAADLNIRADLYAVKYMSTIMRGSDDA